MYRSVGWWYPSDPINREIRADHKSRWLESIFLTTRYIFMYPPCLDEREREREIDVTIVSYRHLYPAIGSLLLSFKLSIEGWGTMCGHRVGQYSVFTMYVFINKLRVFQVEEGHSSRSRPKTTPSSSGIPHATVFRFGTFT